MKLLQKLLRALQRAATEPGQAPAAGANTVQLLLVDRDVSAEAPGETRFGGLPSVGPGFCWPTCASCGGNMQFQAQVRPRGAAYLHLLFMCANHPGECDQFLADGGGNAVITLPADALHGATPPDTGNTVRATRHGARVLPVPAQDYSAAHAAFAGRRRDVLGQLGGEADWLQGDATPDCSHCQSPMDFVAQLESGPDHASEMNFAGGCGYLFECRCSGVSGKFLWQC